jgi:hypothetical protein
VKLGQKVNKVKRGSQEKEVNKEKEGLKVTLV